MVYLAAVGRGDVVMIAIGLGAVEAVERNRWAGRRG